MQSVIINSDVVTLGAALIETLERLKVGGASSSSLSRFQFAPHARPANTTTMYVLLLSLALISLAYFLHKCYRTTRYFAKWGIPQVRELPYAGSALLTFYPRFRRHINYALMDVHNNTSREAKYLGAFMFGQPFIYVRDLELVKSVLVRNFDHFADRKSFVDENTDPLFGRNLNFLNGERWRTVRNTLSPAFTGSKMKQMFALMSRCANNFAREFVRRYEGAEEVDMKDAISKYTCDVIATCAFGIEIDSLKNPDNEFYKHGQKSTSFKGFTMLKLICEMLFPKLTRKLGLRIVSKEYTDFFVHVIDETIKTRESRGIERPDMLQLMMEARKTNPDLDLLEITAQAFLFFLAGFEATTTQTCLMLQEIAAHPEVQAKVHAEIAAVTKNGDPTYEDINNNMPYVDAVLSETLRVHAIAHVNRVCSKDFELPPAVPGAKPFVVPKGMGVLVAVCGVHMDPEVYERPERFDPDRFIGKKVMIADVTNLAFGLGPRMCIGNRFAILEIKTLLVHLLGKCKLVPCERTCLPMEYDWTAFGPVPKGGFWLKAE